MSLRVIHTDHGTIIVISGNVITEVPVTSPTTATDAKGTGEPPSTPPLAPAAPDPQPPPVVEPKPDANPKVWPRPKDGPGVMIVSPHSRIKNPYYDLFARDNENVDNLYVDLDTAPSHFDWETLREQVRTNRGMSAAVYTVLNVRMPAVAMKNGIDTAAFEKLFAQDSRPMLHGIRISLTDWLDES
jgi:hypothetical protein